MSGPTQFLESNALMYLLTGDVDESREELKAMGDTELNMLKLACQYLSAMVDGVSTPYNGF